MTVKVMRDWTEPLLVLGGGGYDAANAARAWTIITNALLKGPPLPLDIPDSHPVRSNSHKSQREESGTNVQDFLAFSPDYSLEMGGGRFRNGNREEDVEAAITKALGALADYAPL